MPRVQSYGAQRVAPAALPGARKGNSAETFESTGGTVAQADAELARARGSVGGAVAGVGQVGARLAQQTLLVNEQIRREEQAKADQVAHLAAVNQATAWLDQRLYDPRTGAYTVKGKDAMALPDAVGAEFDDVTGKIAATLTNDRQKLAFQQTQLELRHRTNVDLSRYASSEMQQFDAQEKKAYVQRAKSDAIASADPDRIGAELASAEGVIRAYAARNGIGPEETAQEIATLRSDVHVGAIDELLALQKEGAAKTYFDHLKGEIAGEKLPQVEKALAEGGARRAAQQASDQIIRAGGTLRERREKVRQIEDAAVREKAMDLVEHEYTVNEKLQHDQLEALALNAGNIVDRTHDVAKIPPADWVRLPNATKSELRSYAKQLSESGKVETNWGTYYTLMTLATNEATRDKFAALNLMDYRGQLGNAEFKQFADVQGDIRKGSMKAANSLLASEGMQTEIVNEGLRSAGFDPTPPEAGQDKYDKATMDRVVAFRRAVRGAVVAQESQPNAKPVTKSDVQSIVDTLLARGAAKDRLAFEVPQAHVVRGSDVPVGERRKIERALRANGLLVSDDAIVRLFNQRLQQVRGDR